MESLADCMDAVLLGLRPQKEFNECIAIETDTKCKE